MISFLSSRPMLLNPTLIPCLTLIPLLHLTVSKVSDILTEPPDEPEGDDQAAGGNGREDEMVELDDAPDHGDPEDDEPDS